MDRLYKRTRKYHFDTVQICRETDQVFTRCYMCWEWKPSNRKFFKAEWNKNKDRDIRPICKECANVQQKEYKKRMKDAEEKLVNAQEAKQDSFIDYLQELEDEAKKEKEKKDNSLESKVQKILDFLWLS